MAESQVTSECPSCGVLLRADDDVTVVDGRRFHPGCAAPPSTAKRRGPSVWAAFGSQGAMAMGEPQHGTTD